VIHDLVQSGRKYKETASKERVISYSVQKRENKGSRFFRNVGAYLRNSIMSHQEAAFV
jgi:hypothetical protein